MWPTRRDQAEQLEKKLKTFSETVRPLPGIEKADARKSLTLQMVASLRRESYTDILKSRDIDARRCDPEDRSFDPERAAIKHMREGKTEEALWLVFLMTHFGKHRSRGWLTLSQVYSGLGSGVWTWARVSDDPESFLKWLRKNARNITRAFGNHRKYESLNPDSSKGTNAVIESYFEWIGKSKSQCKKFSSLVLKGGNDPHSIFDCFYNDIKIKRFGRLGKFDYLALVGRLGLAPIKPGVAYLSGASGPLDGAQLLFANSSASAETLEGWLCELDEVLGIGMQAMEDSLCNWQKSPNVFVHFRG